MRRTGQGAIPCPVDVLLVGGDLEALVTTVDVDELRSVDPALDGVSTAECMVP
jgi:hypothetical protein